MKYLPYGRHCVDADDIESVIQCLKSDWLTTGPIVEEYERAFAQRVGARYAVSCSSGTAALHLAMLSLDIEIGGQVIVPTITFLATANAAKYLNMQVVFSDVDSENALMTPDNFNEALSRSFNPQVVIPVHFAGQVAPIARISEIAKKKKMFVIEDASHALGSSYCDKNITYKVGACAHSDITIFSTHPVKTIATAEGGMVTTNDPNIYEKLLMFRNHGMVKDKNKILNKTLGLDENGEMNPWYYEQQVLGYNYRLNAISCALGLSQLLKLDKFIKKRQMLVSEYDKFFTDHPNIKPLVKDNIELIGWHLYVVLIDFERIGLSRKSLICQLTKKNVGTQVHYIPVHRQPYYASKTEKLNLIGADSYYNRCLSLPLFPDMEISDLQYVKDSIRQVMEYAAQNA